jgi:hypothetical protein
MRKRGKTFQETPYLPGEYSYGRSRKQLTTEFTQEGKRTTERSEKGGTNGMKVQSLSLTPRRLIILPSKKEQKFNAAKQRSLKSFFNFVYMVK